MEKIIFLGLVIPIFGFVLYLGATAIMDGFSAKSANKINENSDNEKIIIKGIWLSFFSCFPQFICGANAMNKINGASNKLNAKL